MNWVVIFGVMVFSWVSCQSDEKFTNGSAADSIKQISTNSFKVDSVPQSMFQPTAETKRSDSIVKIIDDDKSQLRYSFSITALKKVFHILTYDYREKEGIISKITRQFSSLKKEDTIVQEFYFDAEGLFYAVESISTFYDGAKGIDTMTWRGYFYFSKGKLVQHFTLGHGKSEEEWWQPEPQILNASRESIRDIKRWKANAKQNQ